MHVNSRHVSISKERTRVGVRIADNFVRYVSGPVAVAIAHVSTLVLRHS